MRKYLALVMAVGSQANPMTDGQLEDKFSGLAEGILPAAQSRRLMDLCWKVLTPLGFACVLVSGIWRLWLM